MPQQSVASTWCKICGITTLDDARAAQTAGADALGFNCYARSPRYVAPAQVARLCAVVTATRVALFVNAARREVEALLSVSEIDMLQFQGDEDAAFCASFGVPYVKALRMRPDTDVAQYARDFKTAWALQIDAYVPGQAGGTGQQFDWSRWPQLPGTRLILAGGLTPLNVRSAIERLQPFGVDVSGGVEGPVKGRKDAGKVTQFLQEVRSVGR